MDYVSAPSWGRLFNSPQRAHRLSSRREPWPGGSVLLPYGNGRSYGDSCLNPDGVLLDTRGLDRYISFDANTGRLQCEAGMLLGTIQGFAITKGWFLPVTPGTRFVTVGGAIANDVHGKNHHHAGSFGCHLLRFELQRSDGTVMTCSPNQNTDWFSATIGGLGLTGLVLTAELQLRRVNGPCIRARNRRFADLAGFFELSATLDPEHEYCVAWVDCSAGKAATGRGLFSWGDHAEGESSCAGPPRGYTVPFVPPFALVNRHSMRLFNALYYRQACGERLQHYLPFLYPLDHIRNWNRLYGPRGFFQFQCVVPPQCAQDAIGEMLRVINRSGDGSFLAVLKRFGDRQSPGMLSFPRPGTTLAVDFPNRGQSTLRLLDTLDEIVAQAEGSLYAAKDARMSGGSFRRYYPRWREFSEYIDPRFSSAFWRRVMEGA